MSAVKDRLILTDSRIEITRDKLVQYVHPYDCSMIRLCAYAGSKPGVFVPCVRVGEGYWDLLLGAESGMRCVFEVI